MKIHFYIAANKNSLSSIPGLWYFPAYTMEGIGYDTLTVGGNSFLVDTIIPNIKDGLDLLLLLPEQDVPEETLKIFQRVNVIGKTCLSAKMKPQILGPYTIDSLAEAFPDADLSCLRNEAGELRCPHIFAGDAAPEDLAKVFKLLVRDFYGVLCISQDRHKRLGGKIRVEPFNIAVARELNLDPSRDLLNELNEAIRNRV